jgi:hypothetical protein
MHQWNKMKMKNIPVRKRPAMIINPICFVMYPMKTRKGRRQKKKRVKVNLGFKLF